MSDFNPENNILNGLEPDEKIFRVLKVNRFFELVTKKELVLVKPFKWEDPFENFLSNTVFINPKKQRHEFNLTNDFFGQCWTLNKECDGIWRNYASLKSGVKLQTTARKLLGAISNKDNKWSAISYFIGKIKYEGDEEIKNFLETKFLDWLLYDRTKNVVKTLLIKRPEFAYEKEVRLLYDDIEKKNEDDIMVFKIDPTNLIEEIVFAPKTSDAYYERCKKRLVKLGFSERIIQKSSLYEPWKIEIQKDII